MNKITVLGAGLSSSFLIRYLLNNAKKHNWFITIADSNESLAIKKAGKSKFAKGIGLDIRNEAARKKLIQESDLVISLLPPTMHIEAARDCIQFKKNLVTASYVSPEMAALNTEAINAGVLLLNEIGLDPGIDHLSAMKMIHKIRSEGGEITAFKSWCGGLVAPEYDTNPWHYKFTWNPRNVILAGQATAKFIENGLLKFIPPNRIFTHTSNVKIKNHGTYEAYANRDSLGYIEPYGLKSAKTVIRGTLRGKGYCQAWNNLVLLGLTDDTYTLGNLSQTTWRELTSRYISGADSKNLEQKLCEFLNIKKSSKEFKLLSWLGIFENNLVGITEGTPAQALQHLLQQKWKLEKGELDQIVMKHEITYLLNGKTFQSDSSLIVTGEDQTYTAMAKTVGLPMAIAAKLIITGKIKSRGVLIPVTPEFYEPILEELKQFDIEFTD